MTLDANQSQPALAEQQTPQAQLCVPNSSPSQSQVVSQAIALLRFVLVVLVLYLHALPLMVPFASDAGFFYQLSQLIGQQLARLAVPLLFICSGYLLFVRYECNVRFYRQLLVKKNQSLLIPFLIWGCFGMAIYAIGLSLPLTQPLFVNQDKLADFWTLSGFLQSLFGIERSPLVYPLWYVRDLLIFILLSPLLWSMLRRIGWWLLGPLAVLWLFDHWWWFQPALESTAFFIVGALCAVKPRTINWLLRQGPWWVGSYVLLQGLLWAWPEFLPVLGKPTLLIGLLAICYGALLATQYQQLRQRLTFCAGSVFFIFASHEPLLTIVRKLAAKVLPATDTVQGLFYLVLPLVLTLLLYHCYQWLHRLAPCFCRLITGGRSLDSRKE
jgi:hypothetical protein